MSQQRRGRLRAARRKSNPEFIADSAMDAVKRLAGSARSGRRPTIRLVIEIVSESFAIHRDTMMTSNRVLPMAARQIAMVLAYKLTGQSTTCVATQFDGRHHRALISARRRFNDFINNLLDAHHPHGTPRDGTKSLRFGPVFSPPPTSERPSHNHEKESNSRHPA